eukprot:3957995-Pleurochrysis_carterae.AAC.2
MPFTRAERSALAQALSLARAREPDAACASPGRRVRRLYTPLDFAWHELTVNLLWQVHFHPTQPIVSSCGNDKQIYLGEIRP